jgi:hypothetical protein
MVVDVAVIEEHGAGCSLQGLRWSSEVRNDADDKGEYVNFKSEAKLVLSSSMNGALFVLSSCEFLPVVKEGS